MAESSRSCSCACAKMDAFGSTRSREGCMNDRRLHSWRIRLGVSATSMLALVFAIHCGGEGDSLFNEGPCDTVFKGECGKPCTDDLSCASGLHCGVDSKCTAECA